MGVNGDVTMTNLKAATGIADDRLSAHHPDGAGTETKLGDFLIADIGYLGGDSDFTTLEATNAGTYNPPDPDHSIPGSQIPVIVDVYPDPVGGGLWPEAIGTVALSLPVTSATDLALASRNVVGARTDDPIRMEIVFDVTGLNSVAATLKLQDGLNTDITRYDTALDYSSNDVVDSTDIPLIYTAGYQTVSGDDLSGYTIEVTWTPYDPDDTLGGAGHGYYEWSFRPQEVGGASGSTTDQFDQFTTNLNSGTTKDFQLTLYDQQGGTQLDQITFSIEVGTTDNSAYQTPVFTA